MAPLVVRTLTPVRGQARPGGSGPTPTPGEDTRGWSCDPSAAAVTTRATKVYSSASYRS